MKLERCAKAPLMIAVLLSSMAAVAQPGVDPGKQEYQSSGACCHGFDGKGRARWPSG